MPRRKRQTGQISSNYARATIIFVVGALIIACGALYLSFGRTTITITPRIKPVTVNFPVTVRTAPDPDQTALPDGALIGQIFSESKTETGSFTALGSSTLTPGQATGTITIYNTWSRVQPLAATTRLISDSGVLFRLKSRVDVPPGGSVSAEVYADVAGATGNIGPSRFTLPGLWPGLREQIYGESTSAMTGGVVETKTVTADDLNKAERQLSDQALDAARTDFQASLTSATNTATLIEDSLTATVLSTDFSAVAGDQVENFTGTATVRIDAVALAPNDVQTLTKTRLVERLPEHTAAIDQLYDDTTFHVDSINLEAKTAELTVSGTVKTTVTADHPMFDRSTLKNRDRKSLEAYLKMFEEVESVDIHFSPFWLTRTPSLEDHIDVKLAEPSA